MKCYVRNCDRKHADENHFNLVGRYSVLFSNQATSIYLLYDNVKFFTATSSAVITGPISTLKLHPSAQVVVDTFSGSGNALYMDSNEVQVERYGERDYVCDYGLLPCLWLTAKELDKGIKPSILLGGEPIEETYYCTGRL